MNFSSLEYLLFLPLVCLLYYGLPFQCRNAMLLAASYGFYACWRPEYTLLMLLSTAVVWFTTIRIAGSSSGIQRSLWLGACLLVNLGILIYFKYWNFLSDLTERALAGIGLRHEFGASHVLLPVGISFYTFQLLGYAIDVYRDPASVRKRFGDVALYVSFFPQLVAGPIERSGRLIAQFYEKHRFSAELAGSGISLIAWGLFKKMVVADRLAPIVNSVYSDSGRFDPVALWVATCAFGVQIYCDFSGYSDIAVGSGRLLGFRLMMNFDHPYGSASLREFWSRWHISLSTWFRDYVYVPLGGNRGSQARWIVNILAVFILSGLWHGASLTYLAWGMYHGIAMVAESWVARRFGLPRWIGTLWTFHAVMAGWIFFRSRDIAQAFDIIGALAFGAARVLQAPWTLWQALFGRPAFGLPVRPDEFWTVFILAGLMFTAEIRLRASGQSLSSLVPRGTARAAIVACLALTVLVFGTDQGQQFIYFQF